MVFHPQLSDSGLCGRWQPQRVLSRGRLGFHGFYRAPSSCNIMGQLKRAQERQEETSKVAGALDLQSNNEVLRVGKAGGMSHLS